MSETSSPRAAQSLEKAVESICARFGDRARRDEPLGARTTYRVGGSARLYLEVESCEDLVNLHGALASAGAPVALLVVGQGSNLLVSDAGFEGVAVCLGAAFDTVEIEDLLVRAGAAAKLPVLARRSAGEGLTGLEWAVGVPGSVGGALRMNAGGHGSDIASVLRRCTVFDLNLGESKQLDLDALALGYRRSSLAAGEVVTRAEFELAHADATAARRAVSEIVRWRREHQPGGSNAGSVFVNPPDDSAGRLVEQAGLKGLRVGSAQVSEKHANFIQADVGGSADDVRRLMEQVRRAVREAFGVALATEVRLVGFEDSRPDMVEARPSTAGGGGGSARR